MDESQAAEVLSYSAQSVEPTGEAALTAAQSVDLSGVNDGITSLGSSLGDLSTMIQAQNDNVNTLLTGLVTVHMFSLLAQLLLLGVALVVVFVVALRRF